MPRRIAINALAFSHKPSGGKTYIVSLLEELLDLAGDEYEFYILYKEQNAGMFTERFARNNVRLRPFNLTDSTFGRIILEQMYLPFWLKANKIDLLFAARNVMPLFTHCRTVVAILSMHLNYDEITMPSWRRWIATGILKATARKANSIISISKFAGNSYIKKYNLPEEKLYVSPLGYTEKFMSISTRENKNLPNDYLLFVSTLFPHKNVSFLIRVFAGVYHEIPSLDLVIVGRDTSGTMDANIELARGLGISHNVKFMGVVSDYELAQLYSNARLFVFPSLVEGFGLTVLEAMAHSVPVVVSNRTSIPEVVGDAGIILDPGVGNEHIWVKTILDLLEDDQKRKKLAQLGKERSELFKWSQTANITLKCFRKVLDRKV